MNGKTVSRRGFLKTAGLTVLGGGAAAFLAACATPTPQVIKETVVVEKPVEKVVEKVVTPTAMPTTLRNVKLQFAQYGGAGFEDKLYGPVLKKWQERLKQAYPMMDFEHVAVNYQKEAMAMAAGNASDVAIINVPAAWPLMYRRQIANLQPAIDADPEWKDWMTKFAPTTVETYTWKGDLYVIANSVETSGTIYNEDLLVKQGVPKLPHDYGEAGWDWNAYIELAKAATKGEGADKVWGAWVHPDVQSGLGDMVYSNGGGWLSDDGLSSRVAEDVFVEAAEVAVNMVIKDKVSPSTATLTNQQLNAYSAFINEKVCFMVSGDWAFGWVKNNQLPDKKYKLNWWTSPVSPKTKKPVGVGHSTGIYAWAGSKNLPEALAFVKHSASKEIQELWTENWTNSPILAPRRDAQDYFWKEIGPKLIPNLDAMRRAFDIAMPYPHTPLMNASIAIGYVNTGLGLAMDGEDTRPVKEICAEIDKKINADLQKAAAG